MTFSLTVKPGFTNIVTPAGQRQQGGDVVSLPDGLYGEMSATALAKYFSVSFLGGTVSHQVTLNQGLRDVVLPNGSRCRGGDTVTLSDTQYSTITAAAKAALFSADVTALS